LHAIIMGAIVLGLWRLVSGLRFGVAILTLVAASALVITQYSPRPLLFGVLGLVWLAVLTKGGQRLWLAVPLFWLWANSHGSWPIGMAWLLCLVGVALLGERAALRGRLHLLGWSALGCVLAAVGPLGWRVWTFPLSSIQKSEVFGYIVEWQAPGWRSASAFALAALIVLLVIGFKAQLSVWHAVVVVLFLAAGLFAVRNLIFWPVVMAFALASSPAYKASTASELDGSRTPRLGASAYRFGWITSMVLIVGVIGLGASQRAMEFELYPAAEVDLLDQDGLVGGDNRVMAQDWVGCYLIYRYGRDANVFIDDRYDMYPVEVSEAYRTIRLGKPGALELLDVYEIQTVIYESDQPLVASLRESDKWQQLDVLPESDWLVFRRS
jgi:hypothetical protein